MKLLALTVLILNLATLKAADTEKKVHSKRSSLNESVQRLVQSGYYFYAIKDTEILFLNGTPGKTYFISKYEMKAGPSTINSINNFSVETLVRQMSHAKKNGHEIILKKQKLFYSFNNFIVKKIDLESQYFQSSDK